MGLKLAGGSEGTRELRYAGYMEVTFPYSLLTP